MPCSFHMNDTDPNCRGCFNQLYDERDRYREKATALELQNDLLTKDRDFWRLESAKLQSEVDKKDRLVESLQIEGREMRRLLEVTNMYHCGETCGATEKDHNDDCLLAQEYVRQQKEKRVVPQQIEGWDTCTACGRPVQKCVCP